MEIYIYTLSHPITNEVRYVGKTINIKRRYKQHLYDKRGSHKASWVKSLKNEGLKPIMNIVEICTLDNWEIQEKYWIRQFDKLTNLKSGGNDGYQRITTEETKEKIRQANLGKTLSKEHKKKISDNAIKRPISIDGVIYESISDATRILKFHYTTIYRRVHNGDFLNYFYI